MKVFNKKSLMSILMKNAGVLLSGNIYFSILTLFTIIISARFLGPELFGILILIESFVLIIDGIVNLQSFQALIKYGTGYIQNKSSSKFQALIKFGFMLDISTAFLGTILAIIFSFFVGDWLGIESQWKPLLFIYSIVIIFRIIGTPTAILRIFDNFKVFAIKDILHSSLKFIGVMSIVIIGGDLLNFLLVWVITDIIGNIFLIYASLLTLKKEKYSLFHNSSLHTLKGEKKNIINFILLTNVNSTIRMLSRQLDNLIVGGVAGSAAVAYYKMAKQFSSVLLKISDPLYHAIYPQLTVLIENKKYLAFKNFILKSGIIIGLISTLMWIAFLLMGETVIKYTVGEDYLGMYLTLIIYMFAIILSIYTFALQPAMLAIGKPKKSLYIQLFSTAIYFIFIFPLLNIYGLEGAALSYVIYYIVWTILMISVLLRQIRKLEGFNKDYT